MRWDRDPQPGFRFTRRTIAPELVARRSGVQVTRPSLTALDLCGRYEGDGIDRALRTRTATLAGLWEAFALSGGQRGSADRRALLIDSRDQPWSAAERLAHRLLRDAGVRGWKANAPMTLEEQHYFVDIAFRDLRLAIEIDGRLHEDDPDVFEKDRWRQNALVLEGWVVLRFTCGCSRTTLRCSWRGSSGPSAQSVALDALRALQEPLSGIERYETSNQSPDYSAAAANWAS